MPLQLPSFILPVQAPTTKAKPQGGNLRNLKQCLLVGKRNPHAIDSVSERAASGTISSSPEGTRRRKWNSDKEGELSGEVEHQ